jgi:hypothetical protein
MFESVVTSLRLSGAAFRLVFRKPVTLLLPLITLAWIGALVVAPVQFFVWWETNAPQASEAFWRGVFFLAVSQFEAHNYVGAAWAAIFTAYVIWSIWMVFALWGVLFVMTAGMDVATQQIQRRDVRIGAAFKLAARNLHRLFLLALVLATLVAWFKYFTTFVLRLIPFAGTWLNRGFRIVLTAVTYLMLPIVIYERAGPVAAFKSAWRSVKQTWSGIVVGTGILYFGIWGLFSLVAKSFLGNALGIKGWGEILLPVTFGAIAFAVASSVAAAMRATLYWYATTGEVPEGFRTTDLPTLKDTGHPFVRAPPAPRARPVGAAPVAPPRPNVTRQPAPAKAPAKPAPAKKPRTR